MQSLPAIYVTEKDYHAPWLIENISDTADTSMIKATPLKQTASKREPHRDATLGTIKVLLADDHPVVRDGYRTLLESAPDIRVVAEAGDGETCCTCYKKHAPDVVILDLNMPGIGGLETLRRIKALNSEARILVFSMNANGTMIRHVMESGAKGYLDKKSNKQQMLKAVRHVARGETFIDAEHVTQVTLGKLFDSPENPLSTLSSREFQVFKMLAEGLTTADIATLISISPKTVGGHHTSIMKKLAIHNNSELTRLAIRHNVIEA